MQIEKSTSLISHQLSIVPITKKDISKVVSGLLKYYQKSCSIENIDRIFPVVSDILKKFLREEDSEYYLIKDNKNKILSGFGIFFVHNFEWEITKDLSIEIIGFFKDSSSSNYSPTIEQQIVNFLTQKCEDLKISQFNLFSNQEIEILDFEEVYMADSGFKIYSLDFLKNYKKEASCWKEVVDNCIPNIKKRLPMRDEILNNKKIRLPHIELLKCREIFNWEEFSEFVKPSIEESTFINLLDQSKDFLIDLPRLKSKFDLKCKKNEKFTFIAVLHDYEVAGYAIIEKSYNLIFGETAVVSEFWIRRAEFSQRWNLVNEFIECLEIEILEERKWLRTILLFRGCDEELDLILNANGFKKEESKWIRYFL